MPTLSIRSRVPTVREEAELRGGRALATPSYIGMRAAAFPTKCVVANEHNPQLLCEKWLSLETFFWCAELARDFNRSCTATHAEAPRRTWRRTLSSKAADRCPGAHPVVPARTSRKQVPRDQAAGNNACVRESSAVRRGNTSP